MNFSEIEHVHCTRLHGSLRDNTNEWSTFQSGDAMGMSVHISELAHEYLGGLVIINF